MLTVKKVKGGYIRACESNTNKNGQIWTRWKNPFKIPQSVWPSTNRTSCAALYKLAQAGFVCPNPIDLKLDPNSPYLIETSTSQLEKFSYQDKTIPSLYIRGSQPINVYHTQSIKNQSSTHFLSNFSSLNPCFPESLSTRFIGALGGLTNPRATSLCSFLTSTSTEILMEAGENA